jgi:hypothetical protein
MEGNHAFGRSARIRSGLTPPVVEYSSREGCTVIGGYVYRGGRAPRLRGHYFYADHCKGWIRSFRLVDDQVRDHRQWQIDERLQPSAFGLDGAGELYVVSLSGEIYRIRYRGSD